MNTPIRDFLNRYQESSPLRLHMPGHKGMGEGHFAKDLTEVEGADSLYSAAGIIKESEENASLLFACPTYYSTEGSSQCIRAMLMLAVLYAASRGETAHILAAPNVHKTFLGAMAMLDASVELLPAHGEDSYLAAHVSPASLAAYLTTCNTRPTALYVTSPDYLGNLSDIEGLARVCHRNGMLLLVDNAHGAYLKFMPTSEHPIDLGADLACDSAHKTLPALTGSAYLHLSPTLPPFFADHAREALALFGSTSPSYLILDSLDALNPILEQRFGEALKEFLSHAARLWHRLRRAGYTLSSDEPLKLTVHAKKYGYTGYEIAAHLRKWEIECEFADPDFVVLMFSPFFSWEDLERVSNCLSSLEKRVPLASLPPHLSPARRVLSLRQALLSPSEEICVEQAAGRVLATASVSCPPAVPILLPGEEINEQAISAFRYYGIKTCRVVKAF